MDKLKVSNVGPMPSSSQFVKPLRMQFKLNGADRFWDMVKLHNSVSILLFNTSRKVLIFVRQFRPAVYYNSVLTLHGGPPETVKWEDYPSKLGITLELCAGIMDNPKLKENEIAKQEVLEECGYDVPLEEFNLMLNLRSSVGVGGDLNSMFYAEVTDDMKINAGGGKPEEGELIEVVEMTIPEIRAYVSQETVLSPGGFLFAVTWFLMNKSAEYQTCS